MALALLLLSGCAGGSPEPEAEVSTEALGVALEKAEK